MPELGTRAWLNKLQTQIQKSSLQTQIQKSSNTGNGSSQLGITDQFYINLLIQGKKISQLICYIWSNEEPETSYKLDEYFRGTDDKKKLTLAFLPVYPKNF